MVEARMPAISAARSPAESREGQGSSMDFMTASGNETAMDGGPDRPKRIAKESNRARGSFRQRAAGIGVVTNRLSVA